jgi:NTE family protein
LTDLSCIQSEQARVLADHTKFSKEQLNRIQHKYKKYKEEQGAEIKQIFYISRDEPFLHIYENATFHRPATIKNSIGEWEKKTNQATTKM